MTWAALGKHEIEAWHPALGSQSKTVDVKRGETVKVMFEPGGEEQLIAAGGGRFAVELSFVLVNAGNLFQIPLALAWPGRGKGPRNCRIDKWPPRSSPLN